MRDLLKLIESIARKRPVGTLNLGRRGQVCELFIEEDQVYYAGREYSGRVDIDGLLRSGLVQAGGRIEPSVVEAALVSSNLFQKPIPEILLARDVVNAEEHAALMATHVCEEIFAQAFRSGESFSFQESQVPEHLIGEDPRKAPIALQTILDMIRGREEAISVIATMVPSRKEVFVLTEKGMALRVSTDVSFGVKRILELIDGFRSLAEIIRDSSFFEFYILNCIATALQDGQIKKTLVPEIRDVAIGRLEPAEAERLVPTFRQAIKFSVDEIGIREKLGLLYERIGNTEEAVIQYNFIGDALYRMKKVAKALRAFQRALELKPQDLMLSEKMARIYQECAEVEIEAGKREQALALLRAAVKMRPDIPGLFERLLALHLAAKEIQAVSELCDGVVARSRAKGDPAAALQLLRAVIERIPDESLFRKKLINIYLDFGKPHEAEAELEELARREIARGQPERAQPILEKILKINPERDDIRKQIYKLTGRRARRVKPPRQVSLTRIALFLALVGAGYQVWSYVALLPLRRNSVAYAQTTPSARVSLVKTPREENLAALATSADRYEGRFPLSVFIFEAREIGKKARDSATRIAADRDRKKSEIFTNAMRLAEKGSQEEAVDKLKQLLVGPQDEPWRLRATQAIDQIDSYELDAEDLRSQVDALVEIGDWENVYQTVRQIVDHYPLSRAAVQVELPVVVNTVPPGARLKSKGALLGLTPQRIRVHPGQPLEVEAEADGFAARRETINIDSSAERLLLLSRAPAWTVSIGGKLKFPPVITRRHNLLVLADGSLSVRDKEDGSERWNHRGGSVVSAAAAPIEAGERLFLAQTDAQIIRFTLDGKADGRIKTSGLVSTPLVLAGGNLVFGTSGGSLYGWELSLEKLAWSLPLKATPLKISPVGKTQILVLAEKGRLLLADPPAGRIVWEMAFKEEIVSGPHDLGHLLVLLTGDRKMVLIDAEKGDVVHRRLLHPAVKLHALTHARRLVFTGAAAAEGTPLLELDLSSSREIPLASVPAAATALFDLGDSVGVALNGGGFYLLEGSEYKTGWFHQGPGAAVVRCVIDRRPLLLGETRQLLLATEAGELICFNL